VRFFFTFFVICCGDVISIGVCVCVGCGTYGGVVLFLFYLGYVPGVAWRFTCVVVWLCLLCFFVLSWICLHCCVPCHVCGGVAVVVVVVVLSWICLMCCLAFHVCGGVAVFVVLFCFILDMFALLCYLAFHMSGGVAVIVVFSLVCAGICLHSCLRISCCGRVACYLQVD